MTERPLSAREPMDDAPLMESASVTGLVVSGDKPVGMVEIALRRIKPASAISRSYRQLFCQHCSLSRKEIHLSKFSTVPIVLAVFINLLRNTSRDPELKFADLRMREILPRCPRRSGSL